MPEARVVREGLLATVNFFDTFVRDDPAQWWMYLRGIDFYQPVEIRYLNKGTPLVRNERLSGGEAALKPFSYFTNPSSSRFKTAIGFPAIDYTTFSVGCETPALVTHARAIPSRLRGRAPRAGRIGPAAAIDGRTQFIIAFADLSKLIRLSVEEPMT